MSLRNISILLTVSLLNFLFSVSSAAPSGDIGPTDRDYPEANAHPVHVIRITGTISPTLDLILLAQSQGCMRSASAIEGATYRAMVGVPLAIERSKGTFQATVVDDQFLPGQCNWHLHEVDANLSKNGISGLGRSILTAVDEPNFSPQLIERASGSVIWRCRFSRLAGAPKGSKAFPCFYKDQQPDDRSYRILQASTTSIEASFIDLEAADAPTATGADPEQGSQPH
jgi:hypothetical protein